MESKEIKSEISVKEKKSSRFRFSRQQLCIPYALFIIMFVVIPLLIVVYYAFTSSDGSITFDNFISFFTDEVKLSVLLISIVVALAVTLICLIIAYPIAYILSRMKQSVAFILLLLLITPTWINFVLRAMAMKELLSLIGIPLGNFANIIGLTYDFLPFMVMPLYSTLIKMDRSLEEAALDLGSNKAKVFLKVTLPLSMPGVISGAMMVFLPVMSCYVITDTFRGARGFSVIGKLIATCFLGENGTQIDINGGAIISLVMLIIMFFTMFLTGGFKEDKNVRGTNL
ncbi:MAG: ABC transporter permease [Firmicutes bacterium]|nr:ABC transporter permease [Candidatus Caballimonas caccae]